MSSEFPNLIVSTYSYCNSGVFLFLQVVSRRNLRYKSSIRYSDCRTARDSMASDRVSSTTKGDPGGEDTEDAKVKSNLQIFPSLVRLQKFFNQ